MTGERWLICWNEYSADTYLYGSEITCHGRDDVEFYNPMMSPGTVVKEWHSKTNYQFHRVEPALPMIDGERDYRLVVNIDSPPGEICLIRLIFYDRYETEIGSLNIRDKVTVFQCPLKTYSYRMQLINGGVSRFRFHWIVIEEMAHETEEISKTISEDSSWHKKSGGRNAPAE